MTESEIWLVTDFVLKELPAAIEEIQLVRCTNLVVHLNNSMFSGKRYLDTISEGSFRNTDILLVLHPETRKTLLTG